MSLYISIAQVVISIILIASILLQSRGTGLGGAFGGEGTVYRTRRGIERSLFVITIISAILFFALSLLSTFIK